MGKHKILLITLLVLQHFCFDPNSLFAHAREAARLQIKCNQLLTVHIFSGVWVRLIESPHCNFATGALSVAAVQPLVQVVCPWVGLAKTAINPSDYPAHFPSAHNARTRASEHQGRCQGHYAMCFTRTASLLVYSTGYLPIAKGYALDWLNRLPQIHPCACTILRFSTVVYLRNPVATRIYT